MSIELISPSTDPRSLIGRYVVINSGYLYAAVESPMRVLGVSGKRVEVESAPAWYNTSESRWAAGVPPATGDCFARPPERLPDVLVKKLYIACDTVDELDSVLAYCETVHTRVTTLYRETRDGLKALASGGQVSSEPPAGSGS